MSGSTRKRPRGSSALRDVILRVQLGVLMGIGAAFLWTLAVGQIIVQLGLSGEALPSVVHAIVSVVLWRAWVVGVLPGLGYVAGRLSPIRPRQLAITAAVTGELIFVAMDIVSAGAERFGSVVWMGIRAGTLVLGIYLTMRAIARGQVALQRANAEAQRSAEAKKSQYDEFAHEAAALADRREAMPIVAPLPVQAEPGALVELELRVDRRGGAPTIANASGSVEVELLTERRGAMTTAPDDGASNEVEVSATETLKPASTSVTEISGVVIAMRFPEQ